MPSPFPGMDPYLEGSLWTTVHAQLSAEIARQLTPLISPKYLALTNERFVLETPESVGVTTPSTYPDVGVARAGVLETAGGALAVVDAPLHLATVIPELVPLVTVEIRDRANRQLVTAIEVLSPTNKRGEGRDEYVAKRQRLLLSTAHLMEIDLLREGARVPMQKPLPSVPYFVFLSRAESRPITDTWPITLAEPLPVVRVPLLGGDADVPLDLQRALTTIYDLLRFDVAVDYSRPPEVPLPAESASWAEAYLRTSRNGH